jgi:hypothetical protein
VKPFSKRRVASVTSVMAALSLVSAAFARDLWIHPRDEQFQADIHYRAPDGEIYYRAENELGKAIGDITLERGDRPSLTVPVGVEVFEKAEATNGTVRAILLWDSDGDGKVDRSSRGRIEGDTAIFDDPALADVNLELTYWQFGVKYIAGETGDQSLADRYLASVDSDEANVVYVRDEEEKIEPVAQVDSAPAPAPGLVIMKHREGEVFDFAQFVENPSLYTEDFDRLSRGEGDDDWTAQAESPDGQLLTHFGKEDLFIVRTEGGATLGVEWGDMPLIQFFRDFLAVEADSEGCYNTLNTQLTNHDGSPTVVPNRLYYCPQDDVALFDVPDGYEIGLTAFVDGAQLEHTAGGTTVSDNFRLYAHEVYPRSPRARSTGTVSGNIGAGFRDAGEDLKDTFRHAITGTRPVNVHTGQTVYHASTVTAVPRALVSLAKLDPLGAVGEIFTGVESTAAIATKTVSAVNNAAINPLVQATVGNLSSPEAADTTQHWVGAVTSSFADNLPGSHRSDDAIDPFSAWEHNRAFAPTRFTRTDTELNIDRIVTLIDAAVIVAITNDDDSDGAPAEDNGDDGGMDPAPQDPGQPNNPPPMNPGPMNPPPMNPGPMNPPMNPKPPKPMKPKPPKQPKPMKPKPPKQPKPMKPKPPKKPHKGMKPGKHGKKKHGWKKKNGHKKYGKKNGHKKYGKKYGNKKYKSYKPGKGKAYGHRYNRGKGLGHNKYSPGLGHKKYDLSGPVKTFKKYKFSAYSR